MSFVSFACHFVPGLFSDELIQEIKKNKLLHCIVTHPDDIAMMNFLAGEAKAFFENLEAHDVVELRALAASMPAKFELDGEGVLRQHVLHATIVDFTQ